MKFSIRFLLALIVLSALGVNAWQMHLRSKEAENEIARLTQVARERQTQLENYDRRREAYTRFLDADKRRVEQFAGADAKFRQMTDKQGYGRFESPGGDTFKLVSVPTYNTFEHVVQSQRVYVPENKQLELRIGFVDRMGKRLNSVSLFEPAEPRTFPLPPGESIITFRWGKQPDHQGDVRINDKTVFEYRFHQKVSGYGMSAPSASKSYVKKIERPFPIFSFHPGSDDEGIQLSIARPQESESQ